MFTVLLPLIFTGTCGTEDQAIAGFSEEAYSNANRFPPPAIGQVIVRVPPESETVRFFAVHGGVKAGGPPPPGAAAISEPAGGSALTAMRVFVVPSSSHHSMLAPPLPCSQMTRKGYKPSSGTSTSQIVSAVPRPPSNWPRVMALSGS